jgi:hypothetical protein
VSINRDSLDRVDAVKASRILEGVLFAEESYTRIS